MLLYTHKQEKTVSSLLHFTYEAVDWAIHNGVLSEYLSLHKSEVVGMILTEYDEKKVMENLKKESYEEGKAEGIAEGKAEGKAEGIAEGIAEGKIEERALLSTLTLKLISLNRIDDLKRSASDSAYCDKLIKEFFPDK